jgi:hypothetical protein
MPEVTLTEKPVEGFRIGDLRFDDKQRLVDVFAWLIQEDKKQNPELYKVGHEEYNSKQ